MPMFEYACRACGQLFEYLTRQGQQPACPACASRDLEKRLSVFAVNGGGSPRPKASGGPCGTCGDPRGPGSCAIN